MFDVRPGPGNIEHRTPNIQQRTNLLHRRRVLMFQVAQFGDALLPFLDERIELGNLDGVLALFLFAETEKVSPVRRSPTVEEEFVLFANGGAQNLASRVLDCEQLFTRRGDHLLEVYCDQPTTKIRQTNSAGVN